jgi:tetratricopeptide (TPR) repeat protein
MYRHMGLTDKAKQTWTEARDIAKQYNHGLAYGLALRNLAVLEHLEGRFEAAESMLVEAIQIFESHDDSRWLGSALSALGRMYTHAERLSEAKQCIERALEHKRKIQEIPGISGCLANLAVVHTELGEYARALQLLEEGARLAQDHVIEEEYANCLIQKLRIEVRTGSANAPQTAHEVRQICERLGATSFLQEIDGIERNLDEQESGHRDVPIW